MNEDEARQWEGGGGGGMIGGSRSLGRLLKMIMIVSIELIS